VAESVQRDDRGTIIRLHIVLFLISLTAFLSAPVVQISDSRYTGLLSQCLLYHRSALLDEYYKVPAPWPWTHLDTNNPEVASQYQLIYARGHVTYLFPHGSSILSMPMVAVMNAAGVSAATPDGHLDLAGEIRIERVIASVLMAGLTCVFFAMAAMMLPLAWSVVVALGASMGSQILSTASRGLWSHTWEVFLYGLIAYSLLSADHRGARIRPIWLGTLVAWIYCVRPTGAVAIVAVSIYVWWVHREDLIAYAAALAGWLTAFLGYLWWVFGTITPPYYATSRLQFQNLALALASNLIGSGRGLLIFVPATIFVLYLAVRYGKRLAYKPLAVLAFAEIIGLEFIMCANFSAGYCYGPRYFTDAIPWFVLLAVLGLDAMRGAHAGSRHRMEIAAAIFLLAVSVAINARGAWSFDGMSWNPPEQHGIFDWRYPQFMAGLIEPPKN
jgi:hypothetical protein